ncbi:sensor histidine kinase [Streptomyces sp. NPDC048484]|uniref:sensor histidine kinase n=1 Tax=Streptomyces sp. NPDC048484 TaxID=3155146 RepID=UPI003416FB48
MRKPRPSVWWRRKSTPAKIETYTRWSFHFFVVVELTALGPLMFQHAAARFGVLPFVLLCGHALLCGVTASRALDWTRGRRDQPVRLLVALGVISGLLATAGIALVQHGPGGEDADAAASSFFVGVLAFGAGMIALGVRDRRRVLGIVAGFVAGTGVVAFSLGFPGPDALIAAFAVLLGAGVLAFTSVFSAWLLDAVYELDAARETRTRLAVAEERLRFGRDLHDVMGRNLAVIALKSELAVQLARRERPEAVEQMIEVQRIAHESQREVREVVRGYREADLGVELSGAQGVLTAAGVDCTVTGSATGLPPAVQSALGWVVREAATNVLRHGDARRCRVSLEPAGDHVVLTVENDGVKPAAETTSSDASPREHERGRELVGGSGLAGLRERLAAVAGTLEAGPVDGDLFRVVAEVPLPPSSSSPSSTSPSSPSTVPRSVNEEVTS